MQKMISNVSCALDARLVPLPLRGKIVAFALARALAYSFQLPSSSVSSPAAYFNTTHRVEMESAVSAVNEVVVLDTGAVEDLTYKIWLLRYRIVHEMQAVDTCLLIDVLVADGDGHLPVNYLEAVKLDDGRALRDVTSAFGQGLKEAKVN